MNSLPWRFEMEQEMKNERREWSSATGAHRLGRDSKRITVGVIITTGTLDVRTCVRVCIRVTHACVPRRWPRVMTSELRGPLFLGTDARESQQRGQRNEFSSREEYQNWIGKCHEIIKYYRHVRNERFCWSKNLAGYRSENNFNKLSNYQLIIRSGITSNAAKSFDILHNKKHFIFVLKMILVKIFVLNF